MYSVSEAKDKSTTRQYLIYAIKPSNTGIDSNNTTDGNTTKTWRWIYLLHHQYIDVPECAIRWLRQLKLYIEDIHDTCKPSI